MRYYPEDFSMDGSGSGVTLITWREASSRANMKLSDLKKQWLEELLDGAPVVYSFEEHCHFWAWRKVTDQATHKARLVQIEEL